jgi:uncharacterized protein YaiI (UPF0178 family)
MKKRRLREKGFKTEEDHAQKKRRKKRLGAILEKLFKEGKRINWA